MGGKWHEGLKAHLEDIEFATAVEEADANFFGEEFASS
jgi:hypothetical protein